MLRLNTHCVNCMIMLSWPADEMENFKRISASAQTLSLSAYVWEYLIPDVTACWLSVDWQSGEALVPHGWVVSVSDSHSYTHTHTQLLCASQKSTANRFSQFVWDSVTTCESAFSDFTEDQISYTPQLSASQNKLNLSNFSRSCASEVM